MPARSHRAECEIQHDLIHCTWTQAFDQIDIIGHFRLGAIASGMDSFGDEMKGKEVS